MQSNVTIYWIDSISKDSRTLSIYMHANLCYMAHLPSVIQRQQIARKRIYNKKIRDREWTKIPAKLNAKPVAPTVNMLPTTQTSMLLSCYSSTQAVNTSSQNDP